MAIWIPRNTQWPPSNEFVALQWEPDTLELPKTKSIIKKAMITPNWDWNISKKTQPGGLQVQVLLHPSALIDSPGKLQPHWRQMSKGFGSQPRECLRHTPWNCRFDHVWMLYTSISRDFEPHLWDIAEKNIWITQVGIFGGLRQWQKITWVNVASFHLPALVDLWRSWEVDVRCNKSAVLGQLKMIS